MWKKEEGYVLCVDPATLKCGVSLWYRGQFRAGIEINGGKKSMSLSRRLRRQEGQIDLFIDTHVPEGESVTTVLFEDVRAKLLFVGMGIWFTHPRVDSKLGESNFISVSTWKKWAQDQGAEGPSKLIKGLKALREIGWDFDTHPVTSDDVADSILMYKAWAAEG